jgi:hypothetical protein
MTKKHKKEYTFDELGEMLIPGLPSPEEEKIIRTAIAEYKRKRSLTLQKRRKKVLSKAANPPVKSH